MVFPPGTRSAQLEAQDGFQLWQILQRYYVITLLLDTAMSACRTRECPLTLGLKRLTYEN